MSDLETETTQDTTTFEHFGRSWTVPTKARHSHIRQAKMIQRTEGGLDADDMASIYLPGDEYDALVEMNVDSEALNDFASAMSKALGVGDSGNSKPSSPSS